MEKRRIETLSGRIGGVVRYQPLARSAEPKEVVTDRVERADFWRPRLPLFTVGAPGCSVGSSWGRRRVQTPGG